jgi:hypothetical protein
LGDNGLTQCLYTSGGIKNTRWDRDIPGYTYYRQQMYDLRYKDGMIYIFVKNISNLSLYGFMFIDYNNVSEQHNTSFYWHWDNPPLDIVKKTNANNFIVLSEIDVNGYIGMSVTVTETTVLETNYYYNIISQGATSLINIDDNIIFALGKQLRIYSTYYLLDHNSNISLLKQYPNISGTSMLRDEDVLIVANEQGLSFYDISDLENIKLIP